MALKLSWSTLALLLLAAMQHAQGAGCGDERDTIIAEYVALSLPFVPRCDDFTQQSSSRHFQFNELNSGRYKWAILRSSMTTGIDHVHGNYRGRLRVNSGYRNPRHNASVTGSAKRDSRHMHGDAVDLQSTETTFDQIRDAGRDAGACVEPASISGYGHVHLDWRGKCPINW
jgi:hypothetical protein